MRPGAQMKHCVLLFVLILGSSAYYSMAMEFSDSSSEEELVEELEEEHNARESLAEVKDAFQKGEASLKCLEDAILTLLRDLTLNDHHNILFRELDKLFVELPRTLLEDRRFALNAVRANGEFLRLLNKFKSDKEVVEAAIKSSPLAIRHAPKFLKNYSMVLAAAKQKKLINDVVPLVKILPRRFRNDFDVAFNAVKTDANAYWALSKKLQENDIIKTAAIWSFHEHKRLRAPRWATLLPAYKKLMSSEGNKVIKKIFLLKQLVLKGLLKDGHEKLNDYASPHLQFRPGLPQDIWEKIMDSELFRCPSPVTVKLAKTFLSLTDLGSPEGASSKYLEEKRFLPLASSDTSRRLQASVNADDDVSSTTLADYDTSGRHISISVLLLGLFFILLRLWF